MRGFLARRDVQPVLHAHRAACLRLAEATASAVLSTWGATFRARLAFLRLRWDDRHPAAVTLRQRALHSLCEASCKERGFCSAPMRISDVVLIVLHSLGEVALCRCMLLHGQVEHKHGQQTMAAAV